MRARGWKAGDFLGEDHGFGCAREGDESDYGARAVSQREGKRVRGAAAEREPAWELAGPSGGVA